MSLTNGHLRMSGQSKAANLLNDTWVLNVMWKDGISDRENDALQRQQ